MSSTESLWLMVGYFLLHPGWKYKIRFLDDYHQSAWETRITVFKYLLSEIKFNSKLRVLFDSLEILLFELSLRINVMNNFDIEGAGISVAL